MRVTLREVYWELAGAGREGGAAATGVAATGGPLLVPAEGRSERGPDPSLLASVLAAPVESAAAAAAPVAPAAVPADDEYYDGSYFTGIGDEAAGTDMAPTTGAALAPETGGPALGGLPHDDGGSSYYGSYYSEEGGEAPDDKHDEEFSYYSEPDGDGDEGEEEVKARAAPPTVPVKGPHPARAHAPPPHRWTTTCPRPTCTTTTRTTRLPRPREQAGVWRLCGHAKLASEISHQLEACVTVQHATWRKCDDVVGGLARRQLREEQQRKLQQPPPLATMPSIAAQKSSASAGGGGLGAGPRLVFPTPLKGVGAGTDIARLSVEAVRSRCEAHTAVSARVRSEAEQAAERVTPAPTRSPRRELLNSVHATRDVGRKMSQNISQGPKSIMWRPGAAGRTQGQGRGTRILVGQGEVEIDYGSLQLLLTSRFHSVMRSRFRLGSLDFS